MTGMDNWSCSHLQPCPELTLARRRRPRMDRLNRGDRTPGACILLRELPGDPQRRRLVEPHRDGRQRHQMPQW